MSAQTAIFLSIRDKATRLPGKVRAEIGGRPAMIQLLERLKCAREAGLLLVCTSVHPDDAALVTLADSVGVSSFRGSEDDKLDRYLKAAQAHGVEFAVIVDGDDILCDAGVVDEIIRAYRATGADYILARNLPLGATGFGLKVAALERVCRGKAETETEVWGDYFADAARFRTLELDLDPELSHPEFRMTLDYEEDLRFFRAVFDALPQPFDLKDVVRLLVARPEIAALNAGVQAIYEKHLQKSTPARMKPGAW